MRWSRTKGSRSSTGETEVGVGVEGVFFDWPDASGLGGKKGLKGDEWRVVGDKTTWRGCSGAMCNTSIYR